MGQKILIESIILKKVKKKISNEKINYNNKCEKARW